MKKSKTVIDQIVVLCRNVDKTSAIYCQALGLKTVLQSPDLVELKDANNLRIYLKSTKLPFQFTKGYSPVISLKVEYFEEVREKLLRYQLIEDGHVIQTKKGKITNFVGPEGEHISINNLVKEQNEQDQSEMASYQQKSTQQIRKLLNKIKL